MGSRQLAYVAGVVVVALSAVTVWAQSVPAPSIDQQTTGATDLATAVVAAVNSKVGDITAVFAGPGLRGGGKKGDVTLSLDTVFADARYAQLAAPNVFTADQSFTGLNASSANVGGNLTVNDISANWAVVRDGVSATGLTAQYVTTEELSARMIRLSGATDVEPLVGAQQHGHGTAIGGETDYSPRGIAVWGRADGEGGIGVFGHSTATSGWNHGVLGETNTGAAVLGTAWAETGETVGVCGGSLSSTGVGTSGTAASPSGPTRGVYGLVLSPDGVAGFFDNNSGGDLIVGRAGGQEVFRVKGSGDVVAAGDVVFAPGRGIIMRSPNGACFRVSVDDLGQLLTEPIVCR